MDKVMDKHLFLMKKIQFCRCFNPIADKVQSGDYNYDWYVSKKLID